MIDVTAQVVKDYFYFLPVYTATGSPHAAEIKLQEEQISRNQTGPKLFFKLYFWSQAQKKQTKNLKKVFVCSFE